MQHSFALSFVTPASIYYVCLWTSNKHLFKITNDNSKGIFIIYAITTLVATLVIRIGGPILEDINRALQVEQSSGKLRIL